MSGDRSAELLAAIQNADYEHQTRLEDAAYDELTRPDRGPVLVRDSKDPAGPVLAFGRDVWRAFVGGVKGGELDV